MARTTYPCLECGRPTPSADRYVMCDECVEDFEQALEGLHGDAQRQVQSHPVERVTLYG